MNLEELNLEELDVQESKEIEGGFGILFIAAHIFAIGVYNGYKSAEASAH
ncbi:class IIb bacteriocin, lactobin A/cerein 7B family [Flavobacterium sp. F52]|nr:class IIb bacteriocin, lactobin A/cerein 7B family [Flavobacterium sp. F52]